MLILLLFVAVIYMVLIALSVIAYPFVCAIIAVALKRFKSIVTVALMVLTFGMYIFACTSLESDLGNWVYSLYAGILLTPVIVYCITGVEDPRNWPENGETPIHESIAIPLSTFITTILFAIEGFLRMNQSFSLYYLLNKVSGDTYYWLNNDFRVAGVLFFFLSLPISIFLGFHTIRKYIQYLRVVKEEAKEKAALVRTTEHLRQECKKLTLSKKHYSQGLEELRHRYASFCKAVAAAIQNSEEHSLYKFEYSTFNNVTFLSDAFVVTTPEGVYYLYPMGYVIKRKDGNCKYISYKTPTISIKNENVRKDRPLTWNIKPLQQSWRHSCQDGSRDLRYKHNNIVYDYQCAVVTFDKMKLHIYRMNLAYLVEETFAALLCESKKLLIEYKKEREEQLLYEEIIRKKKQLEREEVPVSEPTGTKIGKEVGETTDNSLKDKTHIHIDKERTENSTRKVIKQQQDKSPQSIQECIKCIIAKRGFEVLRNKALIFIIENQYKNIDISEYKQIMDIMAKEDFLYQFIDKKKHNDFTIYNISVDFARKHQLNAQNCLFVVNMVVSAIKYNL